MAGVCDVLVIGGGITGLMSAWNMAQAGADVVLLEASDLGTQASGANAGSLHLQIQYPEFSSYGEDWAHAYGPCLGFLKESLELWQALPGRVGENLDVKLAGGLVVARTPAQMETITRKAAVEAAHGVETQILGADELRAIAPYLSGKAIGGGFCALEGKANPLRATPAVTAAAQRAGVAIHTHTPVEGIERNGEGSPSRRRARPFAPAASSTPPAPRPGDCRHAGGQGRDRWLPVAGHGDRAGRTADPASHLFGGGQAVAQTGTQWRLHHWRRLAGGAARGWHACHRSGSLTGNMAMAADVVPALGQLRAVRSWTAWVNGTPDWRPILGEMPGVPGFFLALFPWVGFSAAPKTAEVTAQIVLGQRRTESLKGISILAD
jgi:sarcosine oxidase subunit beta